VPVREPDEAKKKKKKGALIRESDEARTCQFGNPTRPRKKRGGGGRRTNSRTRRGQDVLIRGSDGAKAC
jgi:hypothetical protein